MVRGGGGGGSQVFDFPAWDVAHLGDPKARAMPVQLTHSLGRPVAGAAAAPRTLGRPILVHEFCFSFFVYYLLSQFAFLLFYHRAFFD